MWSQVTGGIISMTSWLERQWKNGGVSGMEELIP